MKYIQKNYLLVLIAVAAFLLRVINVSSLPPSLNWDEISHGYNAYSILKSGTDEWGALPLANFRAYGDYPLTANLYLTVPFVALFGLTEFAIRFPHVLLGVGTVIATYYLALGITKQKRVALLSSFFVAIDPWTLFTSRFVLQSNLSVFLLISALACFVHYRSRKVFLPISVFLLGLSLFAYHTTRIVTPLIGLLTILLYKRSVITKSTIVISCFFMVALVGVLLTDSSRARANEVFLLNPGVIASIEAQRNESTLSPLLTKALFNRPVYFTTHVVRNYVEYFSPQFLFLSGGTQYQFSIPGQGLLHWVWLPFFYYGLFLVFKKGIIEKDKRYLLLIGWLLIAPIPASITTERMAVLRATTMLPLPELFAAIGFFSVYEYIEKRFDKKRAKAALLVLVTVSLLLLFRYLTVYTTSYITNFSWAWQYGYKEAVLFATDRYQAYDKIIVTKKYGEPHEFFLFYGKTDPASYKSDAALNRYTQSNWWWVDGFGKYLFVNDWQMPKSGNLFVTESKKTYDCTSDHCLLITSPSNAPTNWKLIKTIYFLDKQPAFELYEN